MRSRLSEGALLSKEDPFDHITESILRLQCSDRQR